jgi:uncharacterized membrane protein YkoI/sporulation protein YlmC with PRC-barrel domain
MFKPYIAACLLTTALTAAPALAQTSSAPNPNQSAGRTQANPGRFLTQEGPDQWRGSKLVGLNVYGPNNEKVGDINEVLVDRNGKVDAVVIGVGGFLGIGEKSVAVPFNEVKFVDQTRDTRAGTVASPTAPANPNAPANTNTNIPAGTTTTTRADTSTAARGYPDHAIISLTKDQLNAAPSFAYAGAAGTTTAARTDNTGTRTAAPAGPVPADMARRTDRTTRSASDVQAIQNLKVSLSQAIDTAEKQGQGKAIDADFERDGTAGHYEIKVLSDNGNKLVEYKVDGNSGQVTGTDNQPIEKYFTRLKPADVANAPTSLKQALATAEKQASGKAIAAEVEREGSGVQYKVTVANGDRTQDVRIDGNGQVVSR